MSARTDNHSTGSHTPGMATMPSPHMETSSLNACNRGRSRTDKSSAHHPLQPHVAISDCRTTHELGGRNATPSQTHWIESQEKNLHNPAPRRTKASHRSPQCQYRDRGGGGGLTNRHSIIGRGLQTLVDADRAGTPVQSRSHVDEQL